MQTIKNISVQRPLRELEHLERKEAAAYARLETALHRRNRAEVERAGRRWLDLGERLRRCHKDLLARTWRLAWTSPR
jgi:hypothetical protein